LAQRLCSVLQTAINQMEMVQFRTDGSLKKRVYGKLYQTETVKKPTRVKSRDTLKLTTLIKL
jgi:hypothetical protein